ncbi:MAG: ParA family protein [Planctomycetota bacterium]|jgi:chromosome partitioning protein
MQTIAIVNEKGGTGKTSTAVNLSAALGSLGQKVLLVDLDGQAASSRWLGVEEDNRLADALLTGGGLEPLGDVMPGVSLAPATGKLDSVAHNLRPSQGGQLRKILRRVQDPYDLILVDCPPGLGNRLIGNALLAATHVIVPVETSILALDCLKILLTTLEDMRESFGHQIVLGGVLACRYDGRTRLSRLVLEELRRALPNKVFNTVIRENVRMRECPATGESILTFAPNCHAAEDYRALAEEMMSDPDAWQRPASHATQHQGQGPAECDPSSLDDLRSNAAASVRAAASKAGWRGPGGPAVEELPEASQAAPPTGIGSGAGGLEIGADEPVQVGPAAPQPFGHTLPEPQVVPQPEPAAEVDPSSPPLTYEPGPPPSDAQREELMESLERLAQAETRLAIEGEDSPSSPAEADAEEQQAAEQDTPSGDTEGQTADAVAAPPGPQPPAPWRDEIATPPSCPTQPPAYPPVTIPAPTEEPQSPMQWREDMSVPPSGPGPAFAPAPIGAPASSGEAAHAGPVEDLAALENLPAAEDPPPAEDAPGDSQGSGEQFPALRAFLRQRSCGGEGPADGTGSDGGEGETTGSASDSGA